ncbi:MAG: Flp pilus assembly complex ATPase component TadA [Alphaproteobacteria bacterium]|nr:Flp pilus assembly complex ATPase component TadA [Alphaproteobacteria bacterium]
MEAGRPVSLLKKGIDDLKETWPGEPDRFLEHHIDPFLLWCVKRGASDVTFQTNRAVYSEIYGTLYPSTYRSIDGADMAAVVSRLYGAEALAILSGGADIDLSYEIMTDRFTRTRFRVNMTAILADGRDGVQITMRALPSAPPTMKQLKVDQEIIKHWRPRNGLVLVTGPTGSGKSTLLAAGNRMLIESPHGCGKMLTYEAPIEFTYDTITSNRSLVAQSEIPRHLPTFAAGVRNALRRKPEIILVGEARDRETISAAIEAGQTGHLVFATVHTTGVAATIRRMVSTFEPSERTERAFALMETVRLIVTQTLVPKIGGGRQALREYMPFTEEIREYMLSLSFDKWAAELMQMVPKYGKTMEQAAKEALDAGLIENRYYLVYAQGTKAAQERKEMQEQDETAGKH